MVLCVCACFCSFYLFGEAEGLEGLVLVVLVKHCEKLYVGWCLCGPSVIDLFVCLQLFFFCVFWLLLFLVLWKAFDSVLIDCLFWLSTF